MWVYIASLMVIYKDLIIVSITNADFDLILNLLIDMRGHTITCTKSQKQILQI